MPQNKNLTQIRLSEGGFGGRHGGEHEGEKAAPAGGGGRYRKAAGRKEKSAILEDPVGYTGMNRKYLVQVMAGGNGKPDPKAAGKRRRGGGRKPIYSDEFAATLRSIWAFFWYRCGRTKVRRFSPR